MSIHNQILESVQSDRWCLAGLVTASPHFEPAAHSLTLIRGSDALSPSIRSAMNAETTIPVVEINTPSGMATLGNVRIVNIAPPATTKSFDIMSFSLGADHASVQTGGSGERAGAGRASLGGIVVSKMPRWLRKGFELDEIELTFHMITISHKKIKGFTDDWSIPG
jgi:hypothetical protein